MSATTIGNLTLGLMQCEKEHARMSWKQLMLTVPGSFGIHFSKWEWCTPATNTTGWSELQIFAPTNGKAPAITNTETPAIGNWWRRMLSAVGSIGATKSTGKCLKNKNAMSEKFSPKQFGLGRLTSQISSSHQQCGLVHSDRLYLSFRYYLHFLFFLAIYSI